MSANAIFNGPIDVGTRAALILTAMSMRLSLDDLAILDYALLYSEEFGGPENLHPAMPNHIAEIAHRREYLPEVLKFFIKRNLIDVSIDEQGYHYSCNDNTLDFVSCLKSQYYRKSWRRLGWITENRERILATRLIDVARRPA